MSGVVNSGMQRTIIGFIPARSPLYHLHPSTRLLMFVIMGFVPLFIDLPEVNLLFILGLFVLFRIARVDLKSIRVYVPMMLTVGLFMFLTYVFFPGKNPENIPIASLFGKEIYYQPIRWAVVSYIRILALLFASIFYFSTNRERDILAGLRILGLPFAASYFVGLTLRVAGMFLEDFRIVRQAEQARGLDTATLSLGEKVKLYSMYMIPLFSIALRRSDEITNALFVKGYTFSGKVPGRKRADYLLTKYRRTTLDTIAWVVMVAAFAAVVVVRLQTDLLSVDISPLNQWLMHRITGG